MTHWMHYRSNHIYYCVSVSCVFANHYIIFVFVCEEQTNSGSLSIHPLGLSLTLHIEDQTNTKIGEVDGQLEEEYFFQL